MSDFAREVARIVRRIPKGQVSSYGQVAARAGKPGGARAVVRALGQTPGLPWWRVIRSDGTIAPEMMDHGQGRLLQSEGVRIAGRKVVGAARQEEDRPAVEPRKGKQAEPRKRGGTRARK